MSTEVSRLAEQRFASLPSAKSPESRYWRDYKSPLMVKEYASVSHIHFSPTAPHDFAITSSARVQIYAAKTRHVSKSISRFKEVSFSGEFRKDGRLLIAGDASGLVQVFDVASRNILRSLREHRLPVRVTKFALHDLTTILTASDDKSIKLWDMATQSVTRTFLGADDYIRAAAFLPHSPAIVIGGSYDYHLRLWDSRVSEKGGLIMCFDHGASIEHVMALHGGAGLVTAGGTSVRVWDIVGGGQRPIRDLQNHARGVTCLGSNREGTRVLSGGLDGHVKIYDVTNWKIVHGIKYPAPVLSLGVSPDDRHLVVGMSSGLLSIRTREKVTSLAAAVETATSKRSKTASRFLRGGGYKGGQEEIFLEEKRRKRLRPFDKALRSYRYADALDLVVSEPATSITIYTVLAELKRRSGLRQALSNRDDISLEPILKWIIRTIVDVRYVGLVVDVSMVILEIYGVGLGGSISIESLLDRLLVKVKQEVAKAKNAIQVEGMLSMLF